MKDIIQEKKKKKGFDSFGKASDDEILKAEKNLNLKFAKDYKKYLAKFGIAEIEGHEFTGVYNSSRLNVVDVTKKIKNRNTSIGDKLYVVEELNIDNIVILQNENGAIFELLPNNDIKEIFSSFSQYIESL